MTYTDTSTAEPAGFVPRTAVLRAWQADWDRWQHGAQARDALHRWAADPLLAPHTGSIASLLAACGRDRQVPTATADTRLHRLISHACDGDPAAGRVVLERVMPALTVQAARWAARSPMPFSAALTELVASAWLVIATYPVDRRPVKIAANVVRDTVYQIHGYVPVLDRLTVTCPQPVERPARLDGRPADTTDPLADLFDVVTDGLAHGVPGPALRTVAEIAAGFSQTEIAARAGITVRGVRARRDRAVRALAAVVAADRAGGRS
ncbi:hypothetical protein [Candidatus Protofrankia californiensis]|uniref:hypothetical protein n=1 Tax=Candidatus Protofrankia californiensis TaxID=1839754 RepID=UPI001040F3B3|nr:hypothetical protein [Candidatus Protofrankia californiensis]